MVQKTLKCSTCGNTLTLEVSTQEPTYATCPKCHTRAVYRPPPLVTKYTLQSSMETLQVTNVTKFYKAFKAVDDVSFSVKKGEIFGFLGPNGAGKTTTIKCILDLIHADKGMISVKGFDTRKEGKKAKQFIGYLPEKVAFYDNLTALQNLHFYAEMKQLPKEQCASLISLVGLEDVGQKKVGEFSKGMQQRLGMARAMLGSPSLLILDEPTNGLDARGVVLIREQIKQFRDKGVTIFLSSHILSEVQAVCDRVAIINKGRIVAQDTVDALRMRLQLKPKIVLELQEVTKEMIDAVEKLDGVDAVNVIGKMVHVMCKPYVKAQVIVTLTQKGAKIDNLHIMEPSLEEVFMKFTEETV